MRKLQLMTEKPDIHIPIEIHAPKEIELMQRMPYYLKVINSGRRGPCNINIDFSSMNPLKIFTSLKQKQPNKN